MRGVHPMLRNLYARYRRWRRRRKLLSAYTTIAEVELDKRVGFTPTMRAFELLERDGWAEIEDGELQWNSTTDLFSDVAS
jgi:hypothetical protein